MHRTTTLFVNLRLSGRHSMWHHSTQAWGMKWIDIEILWIMMSNNV